MENQVINVEEKNNLIKLKHKVFSQRIDRLYNIFIVLSQEGEHLGCLRAIEVINEKYEKMYNAILERQEFDKYEEVENIIIPKLAQIEHELDRHIYRTSKSCEQIIESYMEKLSITDTSLNDMVERIKAMKEILKLYGPYIKQQLKQALENKISEFKFDFLIREQIKGMTTNNNGGTGSLGSNCDSKKEKDIFRELTKSRFKREVEDCVNQISESQKNKNAEWIMGYETVMSGILKEEIHKTIENLKKRVDRICTLMKFLYKIEKVSKQKDLTKEYELIQIIEEKYYRLHAQILGGQYGQFLEIQAKVIPNLEELERKLDEYVKTNPEEIDNILNTIVSKEYHLHSLLEENEEEYEIVLAELMRLYRPDIEPKEDHRYIDAIKKYELRKKIKEIIFGEKMQYYLGAGHVLWLCSQYIKENSEIRELFDFPIFDNTVLGYQNKLLITREFKFEYLNHLLNEKFSLNDYYALGRITPGLNYCIENYELMNYHQRLVWKMNKYITNRTLNKAYYLIQLDEETEMCTTLLSKKSRHWPVGGEEFYRLPNFYYLPYGMVGNRSSLEDLYVKTNQVLVKGYDLNIPLDESKMKKVSNEEALELIKKVKKGNLDSNVEKILEDIFSLWQVTEENRKERIIIKEIIKRELIKRAKGESETQTIKCNPLYYAIKDEINRIRLTSNNYANCHNFERESEKIAHLLTFIVTFLELENVEQCLDFKEFGKEVTFEMVLKTQIEDIIYRQGGNEWESRFVRGTYGLTSIFDNKWNHYRENFCKYFGYTNWSIDNYTTNEANSIILEDMKKRPEKYLFVLQAPEENSIVPKETRDKIAQCAKQIQGQVTEPSER